MKWTKKGNGHYVSACKTYGISQQEPGQWQAYTRTEGLPPLRWKSGRGVWPVQGSLAYCKRITSKVAATGR